MLKNSWEWCKGNKKKNEIFSQENNFIEMKRYWLTQYDSGVISKDKCDIEIDKLELNYQQEQLHTGKKTGGEITGDLLVNTISGTVKGIFSMSGVGKEK